MLALALSVGLALGQGIPTCRELDRADTPANDAAKERVGLLANTVWFGLRIYQVAISPADGANCTFYPSCSSYGIRAVRHFGPVLGGCMTTARLLRDHRDPTYPVGSAGRRLYHYNPPTEDDWWHGE